MITDSDQQRITGRAALLEPLREQEIPVLNHQPASAGAPHDLWAVADLLWRYRWMVFGITALGTSIVLAFTVISLLLPPEQSPLPNIYRPSALLLVVDRESDLAITSQALGGGLDTLARLTGSSVGINYGELAITLLETKTTIDTIADQFDLVTRYRLSRNVRGRARKEFMARASFDFAPQTGILRISYQDYDPVFARDVVNRLVAILEHRFAFIGVDQSRRMRDVLAARHAEVAQRIDQYGERIREFQHRHGVLDVAMLAQEFVTRMAEVRTQFLLKEVEIQTYAEFAPRNDPVFLLLLAERDQLLQLLEEMESGYAEYERMLPTQDELPDLALEYEQLRLELAVQTEIYKILSPQYEMEKLNIEGQEPIFQVLELAEAPDLKVGPSRSRIVVVAFVLSLAIAVFAAFLRNNIRDRRDRAGGRIPAPDR